jgi:UDP-3-O-[3-hydroxymyristoyl] glucosamine N-acyltransferase
MLGGRAGVMTDIPAGGRYNGYPAIPAREWLRNVAWVRRMTRTADKAEGDDE